MDFSQALREIKSGKIAPVYLVYGRETHLKGRLVAALKQKLTPGELATLNQSAVDLSVEPLERALDLARTLPFLAEHRLVLVKDAGFFAARGTSNSAAASAPTSASAPPSTSTAAPATAEETALLAYLENPSRTACLVFLGGETVDPRKKAVKAIDKAGGLVQCPEVKEREMPGWIRRRAEEMGLRMPEAAAVTLASMIPNDLELVERELEKLRTYAAGKPSVTREDVERLGSGTTRVNIFKLTGALGARKREEALAALEGLLKDGEAPLVILYMIARQIRLTLSARVLLEQGCPSDQIQSRLGVNQYAAREYAEQATRFTRGELIAALEKLLAADLALKSGAMDFGVVLQLLVLELLQ